MVFNIIKSMKGGEKLMAKKEKSVLALIEKIKVSLEVAKEEAQNLEEKEVKAAALRVRKSLKEVKDFAQAGRKLAIEIKKGFKVVKKTKVKVVKKKKK